LKIKSIRFKIRILFVALLGGILFVYSSYLYVSLRVSLYEELDRELMMKAEEIGDAITISSERDREHRAGLLQFVREIVIFEDLPDPDELDTFQEQWLQKVDELDLKESYIDFLNSNGESLIKSNNLKGRLYKLDVRSLQNLEEGTTVFKNTLKQTQNIRTVSYPYSQNGTRYIIQVGSSLKPTIHILRNRLIHILASIPVILLISSIFGRILVNKLLKPVYQITDTASQISDENLSARVDGARVDEEMTYLVDAFNSMISRLEKSFKGISDFSSHVAHELKTPLTIIKGESDIVLRKERGKQEYKRAIMAMREESDRMLRVIEDLLLLAKLDFPHSAHTFERTDITNLIREICEQARALAKEKGIDVTMEYTHKPLYVNGNESHLRRMFLNLIDNAIKYNRQEGTVHVRATHTDRFNVVSITDTGPGIAEKDLPRIFDRFYRVEYAGEKNVAGTGLGLSIVKSIIDLHHGTIETTSEVGRGSTFTVALPIG
jgi:two-component system OmpR family sensor kinase